MPDSSKGSVFVVGGGLEYIRMFLKLGYTGAKGLGDCDIVCFTGGEDVDPSYYGEKPLKGTNFNSDRDRREKAIFDAAYDDGLPMVGICRGAQFLNVMNGGKLWQHVTDHCGNHLATIQTRINKATNKPPVIKVTSTHHQMMIPTDKAVILLTANEAHEKHSAGLSVTNATSVTDTDVEACFYDESLSLCFQPHPEYSFTPPECLDFFEECLDNWIIPMIGID